MGLKPPLAQAEAWLRGVNLLRACLGTSPPCPQVSDGNISGAPGLISPPGTCPSLGVPFGTAGDPLPVGAHSPGR